MTDSNHLENPTPHESAGEHPDQPGSYIQGDYGDAGTQSSHQPDGEEGRYSQGDFGEAGTQGGLPEPYGANATEPGSFVTGDYDEAETAGSTTEESGIGRYTEGDYGREGVVGPAGRAPTEPEGTAGPQ